MIRVENFKSAPRLSEHGKFEPSPTRKKAVIKNTESNKKSFRQERRRLKKHPGYSKSPVSEILSARETDHFTSENRSSFMDKEMNSRSRCKSSFPALKF